jgi:hypothetical protein
MRLRIAMNRHELVSSVPVAAALTVDERLPFL